MRIAVVGSGVSGLAATWALNEYSDHEVHLYEADSRPGGHANTVTYKPHGKTDGAEVDTGFIVFNPSTYPNFINFLKLHPSVVIKETEMTFAVSRNNGDFEWAGTNLFTVFCQPSRLLDPAMWTLIWDVLRFNATSRRLLAKTAKREIEKQELSIGEWLSENKYSRSFIDNYLIPMTAAIWSTPPDRCFEDFPARTLIQFLSNHHLLQLVGKPSWLTIQRGSHQYVNQILDKLPKSQFHLSSAVTSASSAPGKGATLTFGDGRQEHFDHVVFATHSDTTLKILKSAVKNGVTSEEERILGSFGWNQNTAILHSDPALMPKRKMAWSCWNYITKSDGRKANSDQVALTYGMNDLQHIPEKRFGPVLVTLNPPFEPREETIGGRWKYQHPVLDSKAISAQKELPLIQGQRGFTFAGAWTKYGFHEDGFTSGLLAVHKHIPGVKIPFEIKFPDRAPDHKPWACLFFDLVRVSNVDSFIGYWVVWWLAIVRAVFGVVFDLSHIKVDYKAVSPGY